MSPPEQQQQRSPQNGASRKAGKQEMQLPVEYEKRLEIIAPVD